MRALFQKASFLLPVLALVLSACNDPRAKSGKLTAQADSSSERNNLKHTADLYREAIDLDPRNERAYLGLSRLAFRAGHYDVADWALVRAIDLFPDGADLRECYILLGDVYLMSHGNEPVYVESVGKMATAVLKAQPNSPDGHRQWGEVAARKAEDATSRNLPEAGAWRTKAIEEFEKADAIRPNDRRVLESWGRALLAAGRTDAAQLIYGRLSRIDPANTYFDLTLAGIALTRNDPSGAETRLRHALAQKNPDLPALLAFCRSAALSQDREAALPVLESLASRGFDPPAVADAYLRLGDQNKAVQVLMSSVAKSSGGERNFAALGEILVNQGAHDRAMETAKTCLSRFPQSESCRSIQLYENGRSGAPEAVPELQRLISRSPSLRLGYLYLGLLCQSAGRSEEARMQFNLALRAHPEDSALKLARSRLELALNELKQARADALDILRQSPFDRDASAIVERTGAQLEALQAH